MSLLQHLVPAFSRPASVASDRKETSLREEVTLRPTYRLNETAEGFNLVVDLPGVAKEGLEITSEEGVLTVTGRPAWRRPETWTPLYRETGDVVYRLALQHDAAIDLDRAQAELRDGLLRLTLPKSETAKPRKISVN